MVLAFIYWIQKKESGIVINLTLFIAFATSIHLKRSQIKRQKDFDPKIDAKSADSNTLIEYKLWEKFKSNKKIT